MTQEDFLAATKVIIARQIQRIPAAEREAWLFQNLATARASLDDELVKAEIEKYGKEDAKRSANYRAEIVFLRNLLLANGISVDSNETADAPVAQR